MKINYSTKIPNTFVTGCSKKLTGVLGHPLVLICI